jgi:hypothetical protein
VRLLIPFFAVVMVRPGAGGGCNGADRDGRIGVAGHPIGRGVVVDAVGVGTPADGAIEPGDVILAVDGHELVGPSAFDELRWRARGRSGTDVELAVQNATSERATVTLARAAFPEDVVRRHAPLPTEAEVAEALLGASWWCFDEDRDLVVEGEVERGGRMSVERMKGSLELAQCVRDAIESAEGPERRHGRFVWTVRESEEGTAEMVTTVLAPR